MYYTLEPDPTSPAGPGLRIHVADVSATGAVTADRKLEFEPTADDELNASWLPRGDGIVFETLEGIDHRLYGVPVWRPGSKARDLGLKDRKVIGRTPVAGWAPGVTRPRPRWAATTADLGDGP